jgi:hypothetical protein
MHRGSQPIEFVRERSIVDFGHRWPSGDDAQGVDKVSAENVDSRFFTGGQ